MVSVRLLVEGGGDSKSLRSECRRGFHDFLMKPGLKDRMPRIAACGGRRKAYDDFRLYHARGDHVAMLLVDSESPVEDSSPWDHLRSRPQDAWPRPENASDAQCHLMVQCMEAWFLADRDTLQKFFGQGFSSNALPGNPDIERIPKEDVLSSLERAARPSAKGTYEKGEHSFKLLSRIDVQRVLDASPWARRLVDGVKETTGVED